MYHDKEIEAIQDEELKTLVRSAAVLNEAVELVPNHCKVDVYTAMFKLRRQALEYAQAHNKVRAMIQEWSPFIIDRADDYSLQHAFEFPLPRNDVVLINLLTGEQVCAYVKSDGTLTGDALEYLDPEQLAKAQAIADHLLHLYQNGNMAAARFFYDRSFDPAGTPYEVRLKQDHPD